LKPHGKKCTRFLGTAHGKNALVAREKMHSLSWNRTREKQCTRIGTAREKKCTRYLEGHLVVLKMCVNQMGAEVLWFGVGKKKKKKKKKMHSLLFGQENVEKDVVDRLKGVFL